MGNPYNQLGMGMGMGMNPYMGLPYSPMMGGMMGGPFSFIYSLNYFMSNFAHGISMLSANSFVLYQLFHTVQSALKDLEMAIRRSAFRRWLQRKSRKSVVLRYLFVFSSMVITSQLLRILRHLIEQKLGISSSPASITNSSSSIFSLSKASMGMGIPPASNTPPPHPPLDS